MLSLNDFLNYLCGTWKMNKGNFSVVFFMDSSIGVFVALPCLDLNFYLQLRIVFLHFMGPLLPSTKGVSVFC